MRLLPEVRFWSPAVLPPGSSEPISLMLMSWACSIVRRSMTCELPDVSVRVCAVTTTSSIFCADSFSVTLIVVRLPTVTSCGS